jgi:hypothetical protein
MNAFTLPLGGATFLRRTLAADAATCAAMGALLAGFPAPLAGLLGLPAGLLFYAGIALFPCAALMLAAMKSRALAWLVIAGNAAWILGSVAVLLVASPTALGYAFIIAQAIAVAVLAELEYVGLARAAS